MVNLYLFNPSHKMRFLSKLVWKTSKQMLKTPAPAVSIPSVPTALDAFLPAARPSVPPISATNSMMSVKRDRMGRTKGDRQLAGATPSEMRRDEEYYRDDSDGGFCVFLVQNTLFRVHRCFLLREPSAFRDLFYLPRRGERMEGLTDDHPVPLSDSAEHFRDLMWALYAAPSQLYPSEGDGQAPPPLERVINIAEIAHKYCLASYEAWAFSHLLSLADTPKSFIRTASPTLCARALDIAYLSNHPRLFEVIQQRLVARVLWTDMERAPIRKVAEGRGLDRLRGVVYYRDLVDWEGAALDSALKAKKGPPKSTCLPPLPLSSSPSQYPSMSSHSFLSAHQSLLNLWERTRLQAPIFNPGSCCSSHESCVAVWERLWVEASGSPRVLSYGSIDVLGRLREMMIQLQKLAPETAGITLGCSLNALESVTALREEIVDEFFGFFHPR